MSYQLTTAKVWDGSAWVDAVGGSPFPIAEVTSTTGSPTTGTFTDANGIAWNYFRWTGAGSITVGTAGYADLLIVGGGGAGARESAKRGGGGAGTLRWGQHFMPSGTHTVTVGSGGSGTFTSLGNTFANPGSSSSIASVLLSGGGTGGVARNFNIVAREGNSHGGTDGAVVLLDTTLKGGGAGAANAGLSLNYTGTSVEYARGGDGTTAVANTGSGGDHVTSGNAGAAGVVIVKVPA